MWAVQTKGASVSSAKGVALAAQLHISPCVSATKSSLCSRIKYEKSFSSPAAQRRPSLLLLLHPSVSSILVLATAKSSHDNTAQRQKHVEEVLGFRLPDKQEIEVEEAELWSVHDSALEGKVERFILKLLQQSLSQAPSRSLTLLLWQRDPWAHYLSIICPSHNHFLHLAWCLWRILISSQTSLITALRL